MEVINAEKELNVEEYDAIVESWRGKDMVKMCVGMHSGPRLNSDWELAQPDSALRKAALWKDFVKAMELYYKPTKNLYVKHFQFRSLSQGIEESFPSFCCRVENEAKYCQFGCSEATCVATSTAVRDQIIFGLSDDAIRQEALKNSWELESAAKGVKEK